MDATKQFIADIVAQARGSVDVDRRAAGGFATVDASATPLTRNADGTTKRVFCVGFDAVGDPEAEIG